MPGIYGYCNIETSKTQIESAITLLEHSVNWFSSNTIENENGIHGIVDFTHNITQSFFSDEKGSIVIYGDIFSINGLNFDSKKMASLILEEYRSKGLKFLSQINGSFALSIFDGQKILICTDKLGSRNIYYYKKNNSLIFSSEIKFIVEISDIKLTINKYSLTEFLAFSFVFDNKTLFDEIQLVPPGNILILDGSNIEMQKYYDLEEEIKNIEKVQDNTSLLDEFYEKMYRVLTNRMQGFKKIGFFLSGGLDSRLLVAMAAKIANEQNIELICFTFGTKGGWQEKISKEIAEKLNLKLFFYEIPTTSIKNYAEEVALKGEGNIRIRDAHFISLLKEVQKQVDTVILGLFCSELYGEVLHQEFCVLQNRDKFLKYFFNLYRLPNNINNMDGLYLKNDNLDHHKYIRSTFEETVNCISIEDILRLAHYWEIHQRDRRFILQISTYISWYVKPILPFVDDSIINFAFRLPPELLYRKKFVFDFIDHFFPKISTIMYEKTGVSVEKTGISLQISKFLRKIARVSKKIFERLTFGKFFIRSKDYRAYDYHLRKSSRNFVEQTLSNEDGYFNINKVKKIVHDHMIGKKDNNQIICDLLNLKILFDHYQSRIN